MTSAYECIITTRSFHRTRIELSSAAWEILILTLIVTAEQNIWIIQYHAKNFTEEKVDTLRFQ